MLQLLLQVVLGVGLTLFGFAWYPCGCGCSLWSDCCQAETVTSFDVTLPDDWTSIGGRPCTNCENIGGNTYTLSATSAAVVCQDQTLPWGGGVGFGGSHRYYGSTSFCTVNIGPTPESCFTAAGNFGVWAFLSCTDRECTIWVVVTLGHSTFTPDCCEFWTWKGTFPKGTDCDDYEWELDYYGHALSQCCTHNQCDISGSPGPVTVVKT